MCKQIPPKRAEDLYDKLVKQATDSGESNSRRIYAQTVLAGIKAGAEDLRAAFVIGQRARGVAITEIARKIGRCNQTVRNILRKHQRPERENF